MYISSIEFYKQSRQPKNLKTLNEFTEYQAKRHLAPNKGGDTPIIVGQGKHQKFHKKTQTQRSMSSSSSFSENFVSIDCTFLH